MPGSTVSHKVQHQHHHQSHLAKLGYITLGALAATGGLAAYHHWAHTPLDYYTLHNFIDKYSSHLLHDIPQRLAGPNKPEDMDYDTTILPVFVYLSYLAYADARSLSKTLTVWGGMPLQSSANRMGPGQWMYEHVKGTADTPAAFILYVWNAIDTSCVDVYISCRGTTFSWSDISVDLRMRGVKHISEANSPCDGQVHSGFHSYKQTMNKLIKERLSTTLSKLQPKPRLYLAGHSLGGALSVLLVPTLRVNYASSPVHIFTFAAPKVGDAEFCRCLLRPELRATTSYKVYNRFDPVCQYPASFKHLDQIQLLPSMKIKDTYDFLPKGSRFVNHTVFAFMKNGPRFYTTTRLPSLLQANAADVRRLGLSQQEENATIATLASRSYYMG